ncbi:MAG: hypothetical protein M1826_001110 [Phylliscum demangeonii]|nr:MAG: hypothetical protein M1826_001110 [Phylliscum demangeonii]
MSLAALAAARGAGHVGNVVGQVNADAAPDPEHLDPRAGDAAKEGGRLLRPTGSCRRCSGIGPRPLGQSAA